jgi:predicted PurR-regulated permease PerM
MAETSTLEPPVEPRLETEELPRALRQPLPLATLSLCGLFFLATFYTLYFARAFFMPVVLAVLLDFLLKPLVRTLQRLRIPEALAAVLILGGAMAMAGYTVYAVSGPAAGWLARAPRTLAQAEHKLRDLRRPMERMSETAERLANIAETNGATPDVELKNTSLRTVLFDTTRSALVESAAVMVLLYFLLASGDLFLRKLVRVLPTLADKKRAVEIAREAERQISRYLLTVTAINAGVGVTVSLALWLWGVPNPTLWGAMAAVLSFVPYLGPAIGIGVLSIVSLLTFEDTWRALVAPALYLTVQMIEANIATPVLVGRRFELNPVMVFLSLAFWGFLWGVPGMLVAVPLLAVLKIVCEHVEPRASIGEFLAR